MTAYVGTSGNDNLTGSSGDDTFDMTQGGNDNVNGGDGHDQFYFGATFNNSDHVDGGTGLDAIDLDGDYSAGLVLGATTLTNVESLNLEPGHSYNITSNDATVAAGAFLNVNGAYLGANDFVKFDASAEKDGRVEFVGGAGNDAFYGSAMGDFVDLTNVDGSNAINAGGNGNDTIHTNGGNDQIKIYGEYLTSADTIDGGSGSDELIVSSTMTKKVMLGSQTITNIEDISGNVYLTTNDATVAAGAKLTFDAQGSRLIVDGSAETNGHFVFNGGPGNDVLTGGALSDLFNLISGGNDTVNGGGGSDTFEFGDKNDSTPSSATLTAADKIDGGAGVDTVTLNGLYSGSSALVFGPQTMVNVERLVLYGEVDKFDSPRHYDITTNDATVATGANLTVDATRVSDLSHSSRFVFDGSAETNGSFTILGCANADHITTGAGDDTISGGGGNDTITPGAGNDTVNGGDSGDSINLASHLTTADKIDGGAGSDTVLLSGNYASGITFSATTMINVETLKLAPGFSYKLTTDDATVASGQTLTVNASALGSGNHLVFNGAAETNGHFNILSGQGADDLTGGALSDTFVYASASDSTSTSYDTIHNIDFSLDRLNVAGSITAIDATAHHALSANTLDANLAGAANGHLDAHGAMLVIGNKGTLDGQVFLLVDQNGTAGYQAGQDLVIHLAGYAHALTVSDFI